MAEQKPPFYITTAISYVNGSPHLGHAYEQILTDTMARFKRLDGHEVMFLTGTDEHGQKVAKTAEAKGMEPKAFCDLISQEFVGMTQMLNISNDDFIRTTEPRHYKASQAIWNAIKENNPEDIYLGKYEGWYSVRDEAYFAESELTEGVDTQGNKYKLAPTGAPVAWVEEESYFFRLSAYTEKLLDYYAAHPNFIQPDARRNEVISFVKGNLQDISISRTNFSWGVPVPGDDKHVMYVWLDALTNYITGIGYPETGGDDYKKFWPADYHVIGKDIIRFHCVYWPAFLMAAGLELPKAVFAHGFINVNGAKMSKSVGNVIAPNDLIETYGLDQTRYLLMREVPHGQDGNFAHEHAVQRINSDLANGLGNLVQRSLSMIHKNCDAKIPKPNVYTDDDKKLLDHAHNRLIRPVMEEVDNMRFHRALEKIWRLVNDANIYVDTQAPWALKKEDPERMNTVLYVLAEVIRVLGIATSAVTPESSAKILDQIKIPEDERHFGMINDEYSLPSDFEIDKPEGIFPRLDEAEKAA
ncbi:MAG: methionine--tRNA ligase [Alphaproteobacteria bacterium]|nr:methionine--tRNA ligase [Alphaproteobacteria bacterium]NCQ88013.1 methionine--tRNA ligase [Alphaproteobacteria bacterium]NCT05480.1 methionine--tRNA ligase [Alphaproteobacteria bacterium]